MPKQKVSLLDWRFGWGLLFLISGLILLISGLIILASVNFSDKFSVNLGNGFWSLHYFGLRELLFDWKTLDNSASVDPWVSHPFYQVNVALILLLYVTPVLMILGLFLVIRWWLKTRI